MEEHKICLRYARTHQTSGLQDIAQYLTQKELDSLYKRMKKRTLPVQSDEDERRERSIKEVHMLVPFGIHICLQANKVLAKSGETLVERMDLAEQFTPPDVD